MGDEIEIFDQALASGSVTATAKPVPVTPATGIQAAVISLCLQASTRLGPERASAGDPVGRTSNVRQDSEESPSEHALAAAIISAPSVKSPTRHEPEHDVADFRASAGVV